MRAQPSGAGRVHLTADAENEGLFRLFVCLGAFLRLVGPGRFQSPWKWHFMSFLGAGWEQAALKAQVRLFEMSFLLN